MEWNAAVGIPLLIFGAVVLLLIYAFGRPRRRQQGERSGPRGDRRPRVEPTLEVWSDTGPVADADGFELPPDAAVKVGDSALSQPPVGVRPDRPIERIVTLHVAAKQGAMLAGSDIVVAAEKTGLEFGDLNIFHREAVGRRGEGPVFSMANMVKPGRFDMSRLDELEAPGVSLFMTLPGPLPALDAWDMMLPTAQRLAELLDAQVLDEDRNALGRQRIAHLRDELRAWDRVQERRRIVPGR